MNKLVVVANTCNKFEKNAIGLAAESIFLYPHQPSAAGGKGRTLKVENFQMLPPQRNCSSTGYDEDSCQR